MDKISSNLGIWETSWPSRSLTVQILKAHTCRIRKDCKITSYSTAVVLVKKPKTMSLGWYQEVKVLECIPTPRAINL